MANFRIKANKRRKRRETYSKSQKSPILKKVGYFVRAIIIVLVSITGISYALLFRTDFFIVNDVIMTGYRPNCSVNYDDMKKMLTGENIFSLDLRKIRNCMFNEYKELQDLRLSRVFPDAVAVTMTLRRPSAQIYQTAYYPVDAEGVILSDVRNYPDEKLAIISGIHCDLSDQIGKAPRSEQIKKALSLLKDINTAGVLEKHILVEIDMSNLRNVIFFLKGGLEVKIGSKDFPSRLANLKRVLSDPVLNPADIRYIDLRFKEPVIGTKWK